MDRHTQAYVYAAAAVLLAFSRMIIRPMNASRAAAAAARMVVSVRIRVTARGSQLHGL